MNVSVTLRPNTVFPIEKPSRYISTDVGPMPPSWQRGICPTAHGRR